MKRSDKFIAIDLGGTKILSGLFDSKLKCLDRLKEKTGSQKAPQYVIAKIVKSVQRLLSQSGLTAADVHSLGIGAPGSIDSETGRVLFSPNLKWKNVSLAKEIEKRLQIPVAVENDCNAATLAVHSIEYSGAPASMVGIFVGTGIGSGIVINGKPYQGFNRTAGEIGHMIISAGGPLCGCGNKGCFEALAGRKAIFREVKLAISKGETAFYKKIKKEGKELKSGDFRKAIAAGDKITRRIVQNAALSIGIATGNIINLLCPEVIVFGGGIIQALESVMLPIIVDTAKKCAMTGTASGIRIAATHLGDDAGMLGAAVIAKRLHSLKSHSDNN